MLARICALLWNVSQRASHVPRECAILSVLRQLRMLFLYHLCLFFAPDFGACIIFNLSIVHFLSYASLTAIH